MRTNLLFIAILNVSFLFAQSGNDIANAIPIEGTSVSVNTLDYNSATASGLIPSCGATEDVFYKHDVSSGDNKITIGMASAAILVATNIEYQILRAINGDVNNLVEIACSSYDVVLLAGGSFEEVI
ncbi:hypothetical protein [Gaetbulibacter saemankumensis]|uniref:hypothetical protein n=1 Tax=Gaetbulibacter saemankumensis TaxID=311208 RepID=UPI000407BA48|nr:hypothetical protein [Gaetbulibacter saemankumensis]